MAHPTSHLENSDQACATAHSEYKSIALLPGWHQSEIFVESIGHTQCQSLVLGEKCTEHVLYDGYYTAD